MTTKHTKAREYPIICRRYAGGYVEEAPNLAADLDRLRSLNAELLGELKNAADSDEFYRHETSRSAYLREFAVRARAIIARANQDQDSVAINSPALAEQPESKANAASWPGKKAKAKEQGT